MDPLGEHGLTADGGNAAFGKYELLERLAIGGMAELFIARSASLGGVTRTCVIKRILPQHCANRQFVSMFIDEARIMIGLDHENIVKLYDFGQVEGSYYMALEFVDGFDLVSVMTEVVTRGEAIDPLAAAFVARAVARALHHAHHMCDHRGRNLGIVHRDISPHNVLISHAGDIKLSDFGIALAKNKLTHTMPGTVMGKFAYMAPEQALADPIDARADLFSVGVVLHEMLTGRRLFSAETPMLTITKVLESEIDPPSLFRPGVPERLDRITLRALHRDPAHRFQSGEELATELDPLLVERGFERAQFAAWLKPLGLGRAPVAAMRRPLTVRLPPASLAEDAQLVELRQFLARDPNVWTLVSIGERLLQLGDQQRGMSTLRTAAAVFAHRGLVVQAVVALEPLRHLCDEGRRRDDLRALAELRAGSRRALQAAVGRIDGGEAFEMLCAADREGLGQDRDDQTVLPAPVPLFGAVGPDQFVALVEGTRVHHLPIGAVVVRELDDGDSLYAIGRGRVVVYCSPPPGEERLGDDGRVYLSSLAEGDFFGEFGFLTGQPRSATVETISEVWLLELDRATSDRLISLTPEIAGSLLQFYKERVAELLMAKSPAFAMLEPHQRKVLLARATLERKRDGDAIVSEGEASQGLYFIKAGEVEVWTERDGMPIFLNKLLEGDFFGEIGALRGGPRTANVRAIGDVELLRFGRDDLLDMARHEPRLADALERAAVQRSESSQALISENVELLRRL
ncbi:MAG: cyclic nucleotide-binding domain-containing protein [Deltaproteobacteria bacterium]|nr:cyclic nucleotide-binding domain-containing protein [Deltaproteobacteria bacterium]